MLRDDLFTLATKHGYQPGKRLTRPARKAIEAELREYFKTPEGKQALEDTPREHVAERGEDKYRRMNVRTAVRALLEELET